MRPLIQVQPGPLHLGLLRERSPLVAFDSSCFVSRLGTAVLQRIPALLSSDDFGSRVGRRDAGDPVDGEEVV